ncbi:MAG: MGDG synthase family glycosyltransferase [Verrucomicrobiales bacterium]
MNPARILILTAGFGDGHNSAARALAAALEGRASAEVYDPCAAGAPRVNDFLRKIYRRVTTHSPRLWHRIYRSTERQDFSRQRLPLMRKPELALARKIRDFQPDLIVSTYPLYPYFIERLHRETPPCPVVTVITDSIEINAAWRQAPCDFWCVTDRFTREDLIASGLPAPKVRETGFPVSPRFEKLPPVGSADPVTPFRVLFFPTARKPLVRSYMRAVLDSSPDTTITVVLGRNVRTLYRRAAEIKKAYPGRVKLIGWTSRVPELLSTHHLVVGKAGGATVHEALAARCPMLIHHLVPGQEEGNLQLLQKIGAGRLTPDADDLLKALRELLQDDAADWRRQKKALESFSKPAAAKRIADILLDEVGKEGPDFT